MPRSAATARALTGVTPPDERMARQHAFQHRAAQQLALFGRELAVVADAHALDRALRPSAPQSSPDAWPASDTAAAACIPPCETDGKFTALRMMPSFRKSRTAEAVSSPTCSCASLVLSGDVRRGHDLGQRGQAPVLRRLDVEHVEPGAGRPGRASMASASAASSISSPRAVLMMRTPFLQLREALGIEDVLGGRQRRQVQRDVVGARAQIVQRHELHAEVAGDLLRR